jgi:mRNA interferase YafQ
MKKIVHAGKFDKDLKRMVSRGADPEKILSVIESLAKGKVLPPQYNDHPLSGKMKDKRDCHIEPDWVLVYAIDKEMLVLYRTGTHADLFRM